MKAMVMDGVVDLTRERTPLRLTELPVPEPGPGEVLVKVAACGVCHTELDEIEGRTPPPTYPMVPGHQVVGRIVAVGTDVPLSRVGERVGIGWFNASCGNCEYCRTDNENLCPDFRATGRDSHGGYAQFTTVPDAAAFVLPDAISDLHAAPLLCAGAIGYRSYRLANLPPRGRLGLTGFGASAHLVLRMVLGQDPEAEVYVFARSASERHFALELGAVWAGDTGDSPPRPLHAIIDTTPVWKPVVEALASLAPGGRLVINAIRKETIDQEELLRLDYPTHLWQEKEIKSVANVAPRDIREFIELAARLNLRPEVQTYPLADANIALMELKERRIRGAKVLLVKA